MNEAGTVDEILDGDILVDGSTVSEDEIREGVIEAIAEALDLDLADVTPNASLVDELGSESLDFLDIAFRLEDRFRVRMPQRNMLQRAESLFGKEKLIEKGVVTDLGLDVLGKMMPEVDKSRLVPGLRVYDVGSLLTAETFVRVVGRLLRAKAELPRVCEACGGGQIVESTTALERVCSDCDSTFPLPDGDQVLLGDLEALGI
ncbi:MAG: phosphopantetheine-binding protein [Acidobacteriota bacterium]